MTLFLMTHFPKKQFDEGRFAEKQIYSKNVCQIPDSPKSSIGTAPDTIDALTHHLLILTWECGGCVDDLSIGC